MTSLGCLQALMQSSRPKRPVGVTVIAIVAAAGGVLSLLAGVSILSGMMSGDKLLASIVAIFGILGLALGAGFFKGSRWAWGAGIIVYILSIGLGIDEIQSGVTIGLIGGAIRVVTGVVIPVYLNRSSSAKAFFGKSIAPAAPKSAP
jgi:hypothetical protein